MKKIPLTQGFEALVDDADYDRVMAAGPWHVQRGKGMFYAARRARKGDAKRCGLMHRFILGLTDPKVLGDHWDGNGLNNQRGNLRPATSVQNSANRRPRLGGTSPHKGVSWDPTASKWRATIKVNGKTLHLGMFKDEVAASLAYKAAARQHFGPFARAMRRGPRGDR